MQSRSDVFASLSRRRALVPACLLLLIFLLDLLLMPRTVWESDATQWRQETAAIIQHHRLWIDPGLALNTGRLGEYFIYNEADGRWYSKFGIMNSLMAAPPMVLERILTGKLDPVFPNLLIQNFWYIFLTLLVAAVLYCTTGRYSNRPLLRAAYVLACLFCTYLWYYQRAQGAEIYQLLFFALLYECLMRAIERPGRPSTRWILAAWFFTGLLVLTRVFFGSLILLPLAVKIAVTVRRRQIARRTLPLMLIPPMVILALLGTINNIKFGSPFLTGYHQFRPEEHELTGSFLQGMYGIFFSGHWSVFLYFPLLFLAIPGLRRFAAVHRAGAAIMLCAFFLTVVLLAKVPTWRGEWTYGPRYLLFVLPILSLPGIYFAEGLIVSARSRLKTATILATIVMLAFAGWMQFEVIRQDFWLFYHLQRPLDNDMNREMAEYFYDSPEAFIYHDLQSHRDDLDQTALFRAISRNPKLTPDLVDLYRRTITRSLKESNLYWWPPATS